MEDGPEAVTTLWSHGLMVSLEHPSMEKTELCCEYHVLKPTWRGLEKSRNENQIERDNNRNLSIDDATL